MNSSKTLRKAQIKVYAFQRWFAQNTEHVGITYQHIAWNETKMKFIYPVISRKKIHACK